MKFGKYLSENAVAKWRLYYLDYTRLKDLIKDHTKHGKVHRSNKQFEAEFLAAIEVELDKVNDFFCMTERQLSMKLDSFKTLVSHEVCIPAFILCPSYRSNSFADPFAAIS